MVQQAEEIYVNKRVRYIKVLRYELNGAFIDSFSAKKASGTSL
ncbi:hypothetical protein BAMY6639_06995 [Bacillus amyloliquefaciens UMAF6639]|nr:hypothetical protein BAMY6639_06995 [Bacillus amyloliquefaciens UMAF6639]MDH3077966.1 hypothetical protein [Bacillus velezensis]MDH3091403.1 hypothetical protein [Bacillus velezensis]